MRKIDSLSSPWIFLIFIVLAIVLRFFSFFPSVMDQDEATYFEVGRQLLQGKTLYVDMIDIKPPGMFLIMAAFQYVFGHSIFVIRLLSAIWIGLTAFMLYKTIRIFLKETKPALAGGVMYIFMVSCWAFYGVSINTEIFFNLFTISALYFLAIKREWLHYLAAGLLAGTGFIIKYVMLADFTAFMLFFLILHFRHKERGFISLFIDMIIAGVGFIFPFAMINLSYYASGHFEAFRQIVYEAPGRYPTEIHPINMLVYILDFILRFFPVFFFYFYFIFIRSKDFQKYFDYKLLGLLWSILALVAVVIPGNRYGHYTIQLMLPACFTAAGFFASDVRKPGWLQKFISTRVAMIILPAIILIIMFLHKIEFFDKPDYPAEVAQYLAPRLSEKDVIYTGNYNHIVYYLLEKDSPTPYIHQSLLVQERHIDALQIDNKAEFERIMDQRPVYILSKGEYPNPDLKGFIIEHYYLEKRIGDKAYIYRLRE